MLKRDTWVGFVPFYLLVVILFLGAAHIGSETVTVISKQRPIARKNCIVIDAGHGGIDGGATSCTGVEESRINLEIALRLEQLFQLMGYDTQMIRKTDESVYTQGNTIASQKVSDLKERVRICNETPGALLVSIHQNTYQAQKYRGTQVFYAPTDHSKLLAEKIQTKVKTELQPENNRQSRQIADSIYLMNHIGNRAVLIECGFLTNPDEAALLQQPSYQCKLALVIASALTE
jgi:N-acetylmuramoyl-L-alanine amidase